MIPGGRSGPGPQSPDRAGTLLVSESGRTPGPNRMSLSQQLAEPRRSALGI